MPFWIRSAHSPLSLVEILILFLQYDCANSSISGIPCPNFVQKSCRGCQRKFYKQYGSLSLLHGRTNSCAQSSITKHKKLNFYEGFYSFLLSRHRCLDGTMDELRVLSSVSWSDIFIHICMIDTTSTRVYHDQYILRGLKAPEVYANDI